MQIALQRQSHGRNDVDASDRCDRAAARIARAPMASAQSDTRATAATADENASGNQRSAHAQQRCATAASRESLFIAIL